MTCHFKQLQNQVLLIKYIKIDSETADKRRIEYLLKLSEETISKNQCLSSYYLYKIFIVMKL